MYTLKKTKVGEAVVNCHPPIYTDCPCEDNSESTSQKAPFIILQTLFDRDTYPAKKRMDGMVTVIVEEDYKQYQLKLEGKGDISDNSFWKLIEGSDSNYLIVDNLEDINVSKILNGEVYYVKNLNSFYLIFEGELKELKERPELVNSDNTLAISGGSIDSNVGSHSQEQILDNLVFPIVIQHEKEYSYITDVFISGHSIPRRFWRHYQDELHILDFTSTFVIQEAQEYDVELKGTYFYKK